MPLDGRSSHFDARVLTDINKIVLDKEVGPLLGVEYLSKAPETGTWPAKGKIYGELSRSMM